MGEERQVKISERFARRHEAEKHELDLDALEHDAQLGYGDTHLWMEAESLHALIQRLRGVEAQNAKLNQAFKDRSLWPDVIDDLTHRIAALERVREAATQFIEMVDRVNERPRREGVEMRAVAAQGALRAALEL